MSASITFLADEVIADVRSAAWLESELHQDLDRHRRHQMADICEEGNIERVRRVLSVAVAEARMALAPALHPPGVAIDVNILQFRQRWIFRLMYSPDAATLIFIREKIHEFLVAAVMADRTDVIIPSASSLWRERKACALEALAEAAASIPSCGRRPLSPF